MSHKLVHVKRKEFKFAFTNFKINKKISQQNTTKNKFFKINRVFVETGQVKLRKGL